MNRKYLATSNALFPVIVRKIRKFIIEFSIPVPQKCSRLLLKTVLAVRSVYHFVLRVFIFEPLNKAYCKEYGTNFHHDIFLHWIQGKGDIIVGDNVNFSGKLGITFAARYSDCPTLRVGNNTHIGHGTSIAIGKSIDIGSYCLISSNVTLMDFSGHPINPDARRAGKPTNAGSVKPVVIGDNVWIGRGAVILPGVNIGSGSVIAANSVVRGEIPPLSIVAGNPASIVKSIKLDEEVMCESN